MPKIQEVVFAVPTQFYRKSHLRLLGAGRLFVGVMVCSVSALGNIAVCDMVTEVSSE
jgi:hypothetical protein